MKINRRDFIKLVTMGLVGGALQYTFPKTVYAKRQIGNFDNAHLMLHHTGAINVTMNDAIKGKIPLDGNTLYNVDRHLDICEWANISVQKDFLNVLKNIKLADSQKKKIIKEETLRQHIGNWISALFLSGLIDELNWIRPDWYKKEEANQFYNFSMIGETDDEVTYSIEGSNRKNGDLSLKVNQFNLSESKNKILKEEPVIFGLDYDAISCINEHRPSLKEVQEKSKLVNNILNRVDKNRSSIHASISPGYTHKNYYLPITSSLFPLLGTEEIERIINYSRGKDVEEEGKIGIETRKYLSDKNPMILTNYHFL